MATVSPTRCATSSISREHPAPAATRGSALALWQTRHVASLLGRDLEEVVVSTVGDRELNVPIHTMGGKGVFVKEVQAALLDGRADIAVHSGKDLPARTPPELTLVAVPTRADARDALIGSTWDASRPVPAPPPARSGGGPNLPRHRPDLVFSELRGNIQTRLEKLASGGFDAIVMAAAALDRLELALDAEVDRLDPSIMVPQVAQGALAIECRADDTATIEALQAIQDPATRRVVDAERAFLDELGGDCDLPAGAHAVLDRDGTIEIVGMLSSLDGRVLIRERRRGDDPDVLGRG